MFCDSILQYSSYGVQTKTKIAYLVLMSCISPTLTNKETRCERMIVVSICVFGCFLQNKIYKNVTDRVWTQIRCSQVRMNYIHVYVYVYTVHTAGGSWIDKKKLETFFYYISQNTELICRWFVYSIGSNAFHCCAIVWYRSAQLYDNVSCQWNFSKS